MATEPMLTVNDLALEVGAPVQTIYVWNHKGTGPKYVKLGRHARYRRQDVDAWLRSREAGPRDAA